MSLKVNLRHFYHKYQQRHSRKWGKKTFLTVLLDLMLVNFTTKVNLQIVYDLAGKLLNKKKIVLFN